MAYGKILCIIFPISIPNQSSKPIVRAKNIVCKKAKVLYFNIIKTYDKKRIICHKLNA